MDAKGHRDRIDDLIAATDDPVQRATLTILASIDHAFERSADATQAVVIAFQQHRDEYQKDRIDYREQFDQHRAEFQKHVLDEQKILSGVQWAWWAATGMGAAIVTLGVIILTMYAKVIEDDSNTIKLNTVRINVLESQVNDLNRRQDLDERIRNAVDDAMHKSLPLPRGKIR